MVCENLFTVGEGGWWGFGAKQGKKKKKNFHLQTKKQWDYF